MLCEAATVVLALIGTTLSCMNTGARVTYAMGKDQEVSNRFGLLHKEESDAASRGVDAGCDLCGDWVRGGGDGIWGWRRTRRRRRLRRFRMDLFSSFGYTTHDKMAALPNSLLTVTLASNFGTFLLYALSCTLCMVAYHKHPKFNVVRHLAIPLFGLCANLACMGFYLVGPFMGYGTKMEPLLALGIAAVWGIYGSFHFLKTGKAAGKVRTDRIAADFGVD
jgi:APA family basic amino acid/polyamine antiporter